MQQDEVMETFEFSKTANEREQFYRITAGSNSYIVERDGTIIAELICDHDWKQISGPPLNEELIHEFGDRIENHFS